jgi:hypothetical protein
VVGDGRLQRGEGRDDGVGQLGARHAADRRGGGEFGAVTRPGQRAEVVRPGAGRPVGAGAGADRAHPVVAPRAGAGCAEGRDPRRGDALVTRGRSTHTLGPVAGAPAAESHRHS